MLTSMDAEKREHPNIDDPGQPLLEPAGADLGLGAVADAARYTLAATAKTTQDAVGRIIAGQATDFAAIKSLASLSARPSVVSDVVGPHVDLLSLGAREADRTLREFRLPPELLEIQNWPEKTVAALLDLVELDREIVKRLDAQDVAATKRDADQRRVNRRMIWLMIATVLVAAASVVASIITG